MSELQIRELHTMQDLVATVELQEATWQMQLYECSSPYTLNAVLHNGGNVIGAHIDGQMVGFTFAFPGVRDGKLWLWSHMAGVRPGFQGQQIGFKLKQSQRLWALNNDYNIIAWTFDPMQRGNANFNFRQLGATAKNYYVDHYGVMQDKINAGLASDRLEAEWHLNAPHVIALAAGGMPIAKPEDFAGNIFLVYVDDKEVIHSQIPNQFEHDTYCVEIPYYVGELKQSNIERAKIWQIHVRTAIISLMTNGFAITEFLSDGTHCWYVLQRINCEVSK